MERSNLKTLSAERSDSKPKNEGEGMNVEMIKALIAAKKEFPVIKRLGKNDYYNTSFADLEDIHKAIDPVLVKHGFLITQTLGSGDGFSFLTTTLHHLDGGSVESKVMIPIDQNIQNVGSAITYMRRYSISALLTLITEEDVDGATQDGANKGGTKENKTSPTPHAKKSVENDDSTVLTWGKFKDQKLGSIKTGDLGSYIHSLEAMASKNGEVLRGNAVSLKTYYEKRKAHEQDTADIPF